MLLTRLAAVPAFSSTLKAVQATRSKIAFDFMRAMFTAAKYREGLYDSPAQGRTALDYALKENQYPTESENWARKIKGYNRKSMRAIAIVQQRYGKVYYFLLDRAGVVAWTSSKLRTDGQLPNPRKLKFERTDLNAPDIASDDAPVMGEVVEGVYEVVGTVISTKTNQKGPAMLLSVVKEGQMFKLFGNIDASLADLYTNDPARGTKVKFKGKVIRSKRDAEFGFFEVEGATNAKGFVPDGAGVIKGGEILSVREDYGGDYGPSTKMRVRARDLEGNPFEVEGTAPAKILRRGDGYGQDLVGQRISFGATFRPSRRDPSFGWFSRPKSVELDSLQHVVSTNRDVITSDITEAVLELVLNDPMKDYMVTSFEDGEVEIQRNPGELDVVWAQKTPDAYTKLLSGDMTDEALYNWVNEAYGEGVFYKKDVDRVLNFRSFYDRGSRRSFTFDDRKGREHTMRMGINEYPSYTLTVRYDDEDTSRVFNFTTFG